MLLEIEDLVKEYRGGVRANDGMSISVDAGEVFGLLGPNGSGKTTLVSQIVGLLKPTSGSITIGGVDVVADPQHAREACSFLPQVPVAIDGFLPVQAIELIGRMRGGSGVRVRQRTRELIDSLEIREWADRQCGRLSGGVRRLVGFCMAAVEPGRIVILDEPTNDVDPLRRRLLWQQVRRLAEGGSAVLLVTHNVLEAERAVDRLAVIDRGRVRGSGTPGSLKGDGDTNLRLEVILEPGIDAPEFPGFLRGAVVARRRMVATLEGSALTAAAEWASSIQQAGLAEEFSIGPATLEDVYVRMVGPDAMNDRADGNGTALEGTGGQQ